MRPHPDAGIRVCGWLTAGGIRTRARDLQPRTLDQAL
jgi:hypothetical protein